MSKEQNYHSIGTLNKGINGFVNNQTILSPDNIRCIRTNVHP